MKEIISKKMVEVEERYFLKQLKKECERLTNLFEVNGLTFEEASAN